MTGQAYVVGFLFREMPLAHVALIQKRKPEWQAGKLNGIGGKIELGESAEAAMRREFREETGADVLIWQPFALLAWRSDMIHFFCARSDQTVIRSTTDEEVDWYPVSLLDRLPIIPNLRWLVPLALHGAGAYANVIDPS